MYVRPEPGISCKITSAQLVGRQKSTCEIVFPTGVGYPSDHRALVVELEIQSLSFLQHSTHALQQKLDRTLFRKRKNSMRPDPQDDEEDDGEAGDKEDKG